MATKKPAPKKPKGKTRSAAEMARRGIADGDAITAYYKNKKK